MSILQPSEIKKDFPILQQRINNKPIIFLDSAASSQKPKQVLKSMDEFYENDYSNVHRGAYQLAERATNYYEQSRNTVARFIGAEQNEIIFTKNATESINLISNTWGAKNLTSNDHIVLSLLEHHANIVPWQILQERIGFKIRWLELNQDGTINLDSAEQIISGAKLVSFTGMSNVTGTLTQVEQIVEMAKKARSITVLDACQLAPHYKINVKQMGVDFLVFSGHKMLAPSGIGALWGQPQLLEELPPFLGGGGMIENVTKEGFTPAKVPYKFEAGTPPIAEAVGLAAAIKYLENIGMDKIENHENELTEYTLEMLISKLGDDLKIFGPKTPKNRGAVFSFELKGVHAHDVSQILDEDNICVRPGHHCAKPLMSFFNTTATARASLYIYNDHSDIDALVQGLLKAKEFFL